MDDLSRTRGRRRPRWTLGTSMVAIAALAGACRLARPLTRPAPVRAAEAILATYGPGIERNFKLEQYQAGSVTRTPSGYWQVRFRRRAGQGPRERTVNVSDALVRRTRLVPW